MSEEDLEEFFASAITYDFVESPNVVAQGYGALAKQIVATARKHDVPVLQDFALSKKLSAIPLGTEIPETLYFAIANLFGYILELEEKQNPNIFQCVRTKSDNVSR